MYYKLTSQPSQRPLSYDSHHYNGLGFKFRVWRQIPCITQSQVPVLKLIPMLVLTQVLIRQTYTYTYIYTCMYIYTENHANTNTHSVQTNMYMHIYIYTHGQCSLSQVGLPQTRHQHNTILITDGTPKKAPLILGIPKPQLVASIFFSCTPSCWATPRY